jgi:hypothetical protein
MFPVLRNFNPALASTSGQHLGPQNQQDAQEFLNFLLDSAHEELLRLSGVHACGLYGGVGGVAASKPRTAIEALFTGVTESFIMVKGAKVGRLCIGLCVALG